MINAWCECIKGYANLSTNKEIFQEGGGGGGRMKMGEE